MLILQAFVFTSQLGFDFICLNFHLQLFVISTRTSLRWFSFFLDWISLWDFCRIHSLEWILDLLELLSALYKSLSLTNSSHFFWTGSKFWVICPRYVWRWPLLPSFPPTLYVDVEIGCSWIGFCHSRSFFITWMVVSVSKHICFDVKFHFLDNSLCFFYLK